MYGADNSHTRFKQSPDEVPSISQRDKELFTFVYLYKYKQKFRFDNV